MAWRSANLEAILPLILRLPTGQHYDVVPDGSRLEMQAHTQEAVARLRAIFPGVIWHKRWNTACLWWTYEGKEPETGITLNIYAVHEAPRSCTAIVEEHEIEEEIPTGYETQLVRKRVIVGWNCQEGTGAHGN